MTTWLPAACLVWVLLCTAALACDPAFTTGRDHLVGASVGMLIGIVSGSVFYTAVRLANLAA